MHITKDDNIHKNEDSNIEILYSGQRITFPVRLQNRLIFTILKPVLGHTKKSCVVSYRRQFSTNNEIKIIRSILVLLARAYL